MSKLYRIASINAVAKSLITTMLLLQTALFPDVVISKPPSITVPIASNASYTITVNNTGGAPAPNTVVVEVLPPGLQYVSGPPGCSASGQTVTCSIGDMAPGGSSSIPLLVKPTVPGPLVTSGTVTAGGEQNTANNGPANTTITVVRTCAVYAGDGSSFSCGTSATRNTDNRQSTNPSNAICCVSCSALGSLLAL
jgi:uncharacterized repeat protein (TIGR01451 family)